MSLSQALWRTRPPCNKYYLGEFDESPKKFVTLTLRHLPNCHLANSKNHKINFTGWKFLQQNWIDRKLTPRAALQQVLLGRVRWVSGEICHNYPKTLTLLSPGEPEKLQKSFCRLELFFCKIKSSETNTQNRLATITIWASSVSLWKKCHTYRTRIRWVSEEVCLEFGKWTLRGSLLHTRIVAPKRCCGGVPRSVLNPPQHRPEVMSRRV